jgi:hypothetical protein
MGKHTLPMGTHKFCGHGTRTMTYFCHVLLRSLLDAELIHAVRGILM